MKLQLVKILVIALALVVGLSPASALSADNDYSQGENPGRYPDNYEGPAIDYQQNPDQSENELTVHYNTPESRYEKRMDRLDEKEQEELRRAYRKHGGDVEDPRFQEKRSEITEKYTRERNKVENKHGPKLREGYGDLSEAAGDYED
jgi:hypothetical protein